MVYRAKAGCKGTAVATVTLVTLLGKLRIELTSRIYRAIMRALDSAWLVTGEPAKLATKELPRNGHSGARKARMNETRIRSLNMNPEERSKLIEKYNDGYNEVSEALKEFPTELLNGAAHYPGNGLPAR